MPDSVQFLITHFDRLTEAPAGIAKLRALILQLGMQGRLLSQDPADESAGKLIERVQAEKKRMRAAKLIPPEREDPAFDDDEFPFLIPTSWVWQRLSAITHTFGQKIPDQRFTYIDVGAIDNKRGIISQATVLQPTEAPSRARKIVRKGAVIYSTVRPYLLNTCVVVADFDPEPIASTAFAVLNPHADISAHYLHYYLRSQPFIRYVEEKMKGQAYPAITEGDMSIAPIPVPPLAEQRRIVAKMDELMGLCDALEAAHRERAATHKHLRASALHDLTSSDSDYKSAAFVFENLQLFTAAPEDFADIRQSVLQFAIEGRLSTRKSDELGHALLQQLRKRKLALIASGKASKEKPTEPIDAPTVPFEIPPNWTWTRIAWISAGLDYGTSEKSERSDLGVPVVSMGSVQGGRILLENLKRVPRSIERLPDLFLETGDILFNRTNSADLVGKTGIFEGNSQSFTFASYLIRLRLVTEFADPRFVIIATNAPYFRTTQIAPEIVQQCGQANVNGTKLANFIVPLPPLAEQRRIVAKVDEIMAVLDDLEGSLATARSTAEKLLAATIAGLPALSPAGELAEIVDLQSSPEFIRATLAAQVTDQMRADRHFGQTKLQKVVYLVEHVFRLSEIDSHYVRYARGPHDPELIEQAETGMKNCEWFEAVPRDNGKGKEYHALGQSGRQRAHFEKRWGAQAPAIRRFIDMMKTWSTERCERFATVFAAWNDLLLWGESVSDDAILTEVLQHWHPDKLRIPRSDWEDTLSWMRREGYAPSGWGRATKSRREPELFPQ